MHDATKRVPLILNTNYLRGYPIIAMNEQFWQLTENKQNNVLEFLTKLKYF